MAAGLVVPVTGPYTGVWNALPFGTLSDDGYQLTCQIVGQEINETDAYGQTLVEGVYRGQNWSLDIRGLEWRRGLLAVLQQFGSAFPQPAQDPGLLSPILTAIGDRWSKYGQSMVLTSILGNPPAVPQTLTALSANIAPGQQSQFNMTSKMRELPLRLVLLPYQATENSLSVIVPFTVT